MKMRPGDLRGIDRFALIIGAMKSGTTSLFEYLSAHPQIAPCRVKEPNFFSQDTAWADGIEAYRSLWDWQPGAHQFALEASTTYSMSPMRPGVVERIASVPHAEFRFLYLMRDPVKRIESHLSHIATRRGRASLVGEPDFAEAIQLSRYATQLDPFAAQWSRETILPLVYEAMLDDPLSTVQHTQRFLGLREEPLPNLDRTHNSREEMAADQFLANLVHRAPWLDGLKDLIPEKPKRVVKQMIGRRRSVSFSLSPEQKTRVAEALRSELNRLREEYGVDTSPWNVST